MPKFILLLLIIQQTNNLKHKFIIFKVMFMVDNLEII